MTTKTRKSKYFEPLATAVASGNSIKSSAEHVKCSASQAYRIAEKDEFKARVSEIRTAVTDQIVGQLCDSATKAVTTLTQILENESEKSSARISAAKAVLAQIGPTMDLLELRSRVDALEEASLPDGGKKLAAGSGEGNNRFLKIARELGVEDKLDKQNLKGQDEVRSASCRGN